MDEVLRIVLPLYLLAFVLIAFVLRSYLVWRRAGVNPVVFGRSDGPVDFIERVYRLPVVLIAVVAVLFTFFPSVYQYTSPLVWLERVYVKVAGLVLLTSSFIWISVAQIQMGTSWRIGIDQANRTDLVHSGLFTVSRNPIFLGMRAALVGFFLSIPNAFMMLAMVLGDVLMQIQVRLEEAHLAGHHGSEYAEYRGRVRRWI